MIIRTPHYPWRDALATMTLESREWWGHRANELEESGVPFPESERQAFAELVGEVAA